MDREGPSRSLESTGSGRKRFSETPGEGVPVEELDTGDVNARDGNGGAVQSMLACQESVVMLGIDSAENCVG